MRDEKGLFLTQNLNPKNLNTFMNRLRKISYLGLALGFTLLIVGVITVTSISTYQYSTLLMVPGVILVIIGLIYRWKS
jgi:uncharacterized membrane protein HdeD (DUF308 family)